MKILLIGGAGFIGSVLGPILLAGGARVTVLDIKPAPTPTTLDYVQADIRCLAAIAPHFVGRDLIINLAAEHRDDVRPTSLYDEVNVTGARNICEAASSAGVAWQMFISSVAVYGEGPSPLHEDTPIGFINDYGRTKHLAECVYRAWQHNNAGHRLHIVRPTVVFGPGNRGNVYNLLSQIKRGPFVMIGDGQNTKSIAHVDNVAAFIQFIAFNHVEEGAYNYSDVPDLSVGELVDLAHRVLGRKPPSQTLRLPLQAALLIGQLADGLAHTLKRTLPVSAIRVRKFCARSEVDATRARATGFRPPRDLHEGLIDMILHHV